MKCGLDFERFMFLGSQDSRKRLAYEPCLAVSFLLPALFDGDRHRRFPKFQENCAALAYQVDPLTAGSISGMIRYIGKRPLPKKIDMSGDPACVEAHHGNALAESLVVSSRGGLANAFVYVKSGLEGKIFATPSTPGAIDQNGCWFRPCVLGIQTNHALQITKPDPVTHSTHPWRRSTGSATIVRERESRRLPESSPAGRHDPREVQYS